MHVLLVMPRLGNCVLEKGVCPHQHQEVSVLSLRRCCRDVRERVAATTSCRSSAIEVMGVPRMVDRCMPACMSQYF